MTLSFSKLYLCYDVSPLNKVFTALHRSTQVCILGTISECKDKYYYMKAVTLNDVSENDILETFGLNEKGMIKKLVGYNWENALDDFYVIYEQMHIMCPRPFDGITELIEKLKKKSILIALVTGKGEKSCAITLRQFNMDTCFDKVKTGNPFKNNKAENFRELLADYKLQPDEMIYIGDTVSDIVSCREVGIRCLSASWITSCLDAQKLEAHNAGNVFYSIASLECYLMG